MLSDPYISLSTVTSTKAAHHLTNARPKMVKSTIFQAIIWNRCNMLKWGWQACTAPSVYWYRPLQVCFYKLVYRWFSFSIRFFPFWLKCEETTVRVECCTRFDLYYEGIIFKSSEWWFSNHSEPFGLQCSSYMPLCMLALWHLLWFIGSDYSGWSEVDSYGFNFCPFHNIKNRQYSLENLRLSQSSWLNNEYIIF